MARYPRAEVEGGLYHLIARSSNRQTIFHSNEDQDNELHDRRSDRNLRLTKTADRRLILSI